MVGGDLKQRYYYYHAPARGVTFKGGKYHFCTQPKPFTIVGADNCTERGYESRDFRKLDTGKKAKSFKLTLTETSSKSTQTKKAPVKQQTARQAPTEPRAAKPGTYGEPATITGTFKGCNRSGDPEYCEIQTDEWIYVVPKDDRTPSPLYRKLASAKAGRAVTVEGDIVGYGDISVDMTARKITFASASSPATDLHGRLSGLWRSRDDAASAIRFENGRYFDYYDGKLLEEGSYALSQACEGRTADLVVRFDGSPDPFCYGIGALTSANLDLIYLSRGNTLSYTRAGN